MNNEITTKKTFFTVQENSNYAVTMTYDTVEIIEYEQFLKLGKVLNDAQHQFVTINNRIRNKNSIIDISPTKEKTQAQKQDYEMHAKEVREQERRKKAELKKETEHRYNTLITELNSRYGHSGWTMRIFNASSDKHHVSGSEIDQILREAGFEF